MTTIDLSKLQRTAQTAIQKIAEHPDATPEQKKAELWRILVWCKSQRDNVELEDKK